MGSPDDASSRSRSSPDHQPGGECEQATGATVKNDRGVPISFDGDTLYEPTGGLPAAEAVHRLSREEKASQRQIQTSLGQNKTSSSGLAEKLPKTGNLSNRKGTRFRAYDIVNPILFHYHLTRHKFNPEILRLRSSNDPSSSLPTSVLPCDSLPLFSRKGPISEESSPTAQPERKFHLPMSLS